MTSPLTEQQLTDIEARATAATQGPWTVELEQCDCSDGYCHHGTYVSAIYAADGARRDEIGDFTDADWQFTIHARQDVPALLAEVRRLQTELETANARVNAVTDLLDQQELAARGFEVPLPEWVSVVRRAVDAAPAAPAV